MKLSLSNKLDKKLENLLIHLFEKKEVPKYLSGKGKKKTKNANDIMDNKQHNI